MSETIAVALLSFFGSLIGAGLIFLVAWEKLKPEIRRVKADTNHSTAEASTSWAQSSEMAAKQLVILQEELIKVRTQHIQDCADSSELRVKVQMQDKRIARLEAQLVSLGVEPVK